MQACELVSQIFSFLDSFKRLWWCGLCLLRQLWPNCHHIKQSPAVNLPKIMKIVKRMIWAGMQVHATKRWRSSDCFKEKHHMVFLIRIRNVSKYNEANNFSTCTTTNSVWYEPHWYHAKDGKLFLVDCYKASGVGLATTFSRKLPKWNSKFPISQYDSAKETELQSWAKIWIFIIPARHLKNWRKK